ncbi:hypothetical protein CRG98_032127 [Punica granatum]|uniref:Uncharacterized protein n=1 Tax=Punica granatum TaxID=22663 RepID=A0A2I0IU52_PUNGR|nr:hypothetical protein CRG98_032127 [Punica granatum]
MAFTLCWLLPLLVTSLSELLDRKRETQIEIRVRAVQLDFNRPLINNRELTNYVGDSDWRAAIAGGVSKRERDQRDGVRTRESYVLQPLEGTRGRGRELEVAGLRSRARGCGFVSVSMYIDVC